MAPRAGFEPATKRLTVACSTTELPRNEEDNGNVHISIISPNEHGKLLLTSTSEEQNGCSHTFCPSAVEASFTYRGIHRSFCEEKNRVIVPEKVLYSSMLYLAEHVDTNRYRHTLVCCRRCMYGGGGALYAPEKSKFFYRPF